MYISEKMWVARTDSLGTVRLYEMKASLGLFRGRGLLRARSAVNSSLHSASVHNPNGGGEEKRAREKKEGEPLLGGR